jgi:hypothetical protein
MTEKKLDTQRGALNSRNRWLLICISIMLVGTVLSLWAHGWQWCW